MIAWLVFFMLGFLMDKIRLFPFLLGGIVGFLLAALMGNSFSPDLPGLKLCGTSLCEKVQAIYTSACTGDL
jgi:multisubunit Na+/H+ antiporter MnhE subunit